jgi:hypothetical protein
MHLLVSIIQLQILQKIASFGAVDVFVEPVHRNEPVRATSKLTFRGAS